MGHCTFGRSGISYWEGTENCRKLRKNPPKWVRKAALRVILVVNGDLMRATSRELLDQLTHHVLGVAKEHPSSIREVELVVDAGEPRVLAAFDRKDRSGLVGVDDRHPVDRARFLAPGRRVHHV